MIHSRSLIAAAVLAGVSTASGAQAQGGPPEDAGLGDLLQALGERLRSFDPSWSCFQGHPIPVCKRFWIAELGYGYLLNQGPGSATQQGTLELGGMANVDQRSAVGGTAYFSSFGFGLKARYRYWLGGNVSLEASPGILLWDNDTCA